MLKGTFCCYKDGKSNFIGTAKTDCRFKVHFRMKPSTGIYTFTPNHLLIHNHIMDPASTLMAAVTRRFAPKQLDTIEEMHFQWICSGANRHRTEENHKCCRVNKGRLQRPKTFWKDLTSRGFQKSRL